VVCMLVVEVVFFVLVEEDDWTFSFAGEDVVCMLVVEVVFVVLVEEDLWTVVVGCSVVSADVGIVIGPRLISSSSELLVDGLGFALVTFAVVLFVVVVAFADVLCTVVECVDDLTVVLTDVVVEAEVLTEMTDDCLLVVFADTAVVEGSAWVEVVGCVKTPRLIPSSVDVEDVVVTRSEVAACFVEPCVLLKVLDTVLAVCTEVVETTDEVLGDFEILCVEDVR